MSAVDLRLQIRQQRRQLGVGSQLKASRTLSKFITRSLLYQQSQRIAVYLAVDGELNCGELIKAIWLDQKQCYLPVLVRTENGLAMKFSQYLPGMTLTKNRYGIPEVSGGALMEPLDLDLVIVPLVGFDSDCNRMGMGGGFYDRAFAERRFYDGKPWLIGVAHKLQHVSKLSVAEWDVSMDHIVAV